LGSDEGSEINIEHLASGSDTSRRISLTRIRTNLLQIHSSPLRTSKRRGCAIIVF